LFLDEIGELDLKMQVKLLRVLDGVTYYRLGGTRKVTADTRIVAATNQDLERLVSEGRFRGDLYHRLCQLTLRVPPLRQRLDDIAPLAWHILGHHNPEASFTSRALRLLESHAWPGNVRELRNVVMNAAVMNTELEIDVGHLSLNTFSGNAFSGSASGLSALDRAMGSGGMGTPAANGAGANTASLDHMERRMIFDALAEAGGHQQQAASRLGISRRTLSRKLKGYEGERAGATA
jgi:DNA-binding NtrC family response regulator